jgi:hypothetical protein
MHIGLGVASDIETQDVIDLRKAEHDLRRRQRI